MIQDLLDKHRRLKEKIHSTRIPLSRRGKIIMGIIYATTPIVCGYFIMQGTNSYSKKELGDKVIVLTERFCPPTDC